MTRIGTNYKHERPVPRPAWPFSLQPFRALSASPPHGGIYVIDFTREPVNPQCYQGFLNIRPVR